jgi:hypothetical protein
LQPASPAANQIGRPKGAITRDGILSRTRSCSRLRIVSHFRRILAEVFARRAGALENVRQLPVHRRARPSGLRAERYPVISAAVCCVAGLLVQAVFMSGKPSRAFARRKAISRQDFAQVFNFTGRTFPSMWQRVAVCRILTPQLHVTRWHEQSGEPPVSAPTRISIPATTEQQQHYKNNQNRHHFLPLSCVSSPS